MSTTNYSEDEGLGGKSLLVQNRQSTKSREQEFDISKLKPLIDLASSYEPDDKVGLGFSQFGNIVPSNIKDKHLDYLTSQSLDNLYEYAANQQPTSAKIANSIIGGLGGGLLTALESVSYLSPFQVYANTMDTADEYERNVIGNFAKKTKESLYEALPIYRKDPNDPIDWSDRGFYWDAFRGVLDSAVGFGLPGLGVAKVMKLATKAMPLLFGETFATLGSATATNYMEGRVMASQTYDDILKQFREDPVAYGQMYNEVMSEYKTQNPNIDDTQLDQSVKEEVDRRAKKIAAKQADNVVNRNRLFILSDALAFAGLFRATKYVDDILKPRNFRQFAGLAAKQAPIEYAEEVGQSVLQKESEFQALKGLGMDVSKHSDDFLTRAIEFAAEEDTQLEGLMGFFSGPLQFSAVQAPSYFGGMKKYNEKVTEQQEQINKLHGNFNTYVNGFVKNEFAKKAAYESGNYELGEQIQQENFENLAYQHFENGSYESLRQKLEEVSRGENVPENSDENHRQTARSMLNTLDELRRDYINVRNSEKGEDHALLRGHRFAAKRRLRGLEKANREINNKIREKESELSKRSGEIATNLNKQSSKVHEELELLKQKKLGYQDEIKTIKDTIAETNERQSFLQKRNDGINENKDRFTIARINPGTISNQTAYVVAAINDDVIPEKDDLFNASSELSALWNRLEAQKSTFREESDIVSINEKQAEIDAYLKRIDEAIKDNTNIKRPAPSFNDLEKKVANNKNTVVEQNKSIENLSKDITGIDKEIEQKQAEAKEIGAEFNRIKSKDFTGQDEYRELSKQQASVKEAQRVLLEKYNKLNSAKYTKEVGDNRRDLIKKKEEALQNLQKIQEEIIAKQEAENQAKDELKKKAEQHKGKTYRIKMKDTKGVESEVNVIVDESNPEYLLNADAMLEGRTVRYHVKAYIDQLTEENLSETQLNPEQVKKYFEKMQNPEDTASNKPGFDNVDTQVTFVYGEDYAMPDIFGVGFGKSTGLVVSATDLETVLHIKESTGIDLIKLHGEEKAKAIAHELAESNKRFFAITGQMNAKTMGNYGLMAVTSSNNPFGEELFFVEKDSSVEGADIKIILYDKKTNKPVRLVNDGNKMVYTSISLPTLLSPAKTPRFTLKVQKGKVSVNVMPMGEFADSQALIDAVEDPNHKIALEDTLASFKLFREKILNEKQPPILDIKGRSKGFGKSDGVIRPVAGSILDEKANLEKVDIQVATIGEIVTNEGIEQVEPGYTYILIDGDAYPIKGSNLDDVTILNIVRLLKMFSSNYKTENVKDAVYANDAAGKKTAYNIFHTINNLIYFGAKSKTKKGGVNNDFYIGYHEGKLEFGSEGQFITEDDLIASKVVLSGDGTIDLNQSSESIVALVEFLRNKTFHINKPALGTKVEMLVADENQDGTVFISAKPKKESYNKFLLEDRANGPRVGTTVPSRKIVLVDKKAGVVNEAVESEDLNFLKNNNPLAGVYLMFDVGAETKEVKPTITESTEPAQPTMEAGKVIKTAEELEANKGDFEGNDITVTIKAISKRTGNTATIQVSVSEDGVVTASTDIPGASFGEQGNASSHEWIKGLINATLIHSSSISYTVESNTKPEDESGVIDIPLEEPDRPPAITNEHGDPINPDDGVFMGWSESDASKFGYITMEQEIAWFAERFPNVPIKTIRGLVQGKHSAMLTKYAQVLLSDMAIAGALYHEGYHYVSLFLTSPEERHAIYNEYRARHKKESLTDKQVEEALAELFREYMIADGNMVIADKRTKNIFQRIYDFVKRLFGGEDRLIENKFKQIASNNIKVSYITPSISEDVAMNGFTVEQVKAVTDAMNAYFFKTFFGNSDISFEDLFTLDSHELNKRHRNQISSIYTKIEQTIKGDFYRQREHLREKIKNTKDKNLIELLNEEIKELDSFDMRVSQAWKFFIDEHMKLLRSKNIEFGLSEDVEDFEFNENVKDSTQYVESMHFSSKSKASKIVKLLLSSLPRVNLDRTAVRNSLGLPSTVDSSAVFDMLHTKLAGTTSYEKQIEIIKQNYARFPYLRILVSRLGSENQATSTDNTDAQTDLQNKFLQQFGKTHNTFWLAVVGADGEINFFDSQNKRLHDKYKNKWRFNHKVLWDSENSLIEMKNGEVLVSTSKKYKLSTGKKLGILEYEKANLTLEERLEFLGGLGIELSNPKEIVATLTVEEKNDILKAVNFVIKEAIEVKDVNNLFDSKTSIVQGRIQQLIQLQVDSKQDFFELQHANLDGKRVYGINLNTYLSLLVNEINEGNIPARILQDPYNQNSEWLVKAREGKLRIVIVEGARVDKESTGSSMYKMNKADRFMQMINSVFAGVSPFVRAGDRQVEYGIEIEGFGDKMTQEDFVKKLYKYLEDEVTSAIDNREVKDGYTHSTYANKIKDLRFFKDIIGESIADVNSFEEFVLRVGYDQIFERLNNYAKQLTEDTISLFRENDIIDSANRVIGVSKNALTKILDTADNHLTENQIKVLVSSFAYNYVAGNIEQTKLFIGDTAYYSDLFKRLTGITSTKKILNVDKSYNDWLDAKSQRADGKKQDGTFNVIVRDDVTGISDLSDVYSEATGQKGVYGEYNEADAQGYISLDAYREFMKRSGDWTSKQEKLYKWIIDKREKKDVGRKPNAVFPPLKPQYFGPDANFDGKNVPVFYKFSVFPIYDELFEGRFANSQLKDLAKDMFSNSIDIVLFETGNKVGRLKKVENGKMLSDPMYGTDGKMNPLNTDLIQKIDLKYFGNQLDIAPKIKESTIFGTQYRSLISSNLYLSGLPIDFNGTSEIWNAMSEEEKASTSPIYRLESEFHSIINNNIDKDWDSLLDEVGLSFNESTSSYSFNGDYKAFSDLITQSMVERGLSPNVINGFLHAIDSKKKFLDLLANKDQIEYLLFSVVRNNVIRQKVNGDMLVQVASTGFEVEARKQKDDKWTSNSDALKFYSINEDKTINTMQVYAPNFLRNKLKRGDKLQVVNGQIVRDGEVLSEDKRIVMAIGFRIPTSGLSSIEFIEIKDFLPVEAGSAVVTPSEIVTKSGSDYDIDKLTIFYPNTYVTKDGKIKYIDKAENVEAQYQEYIEAMEQKLTQLLKEDLYFESKETQTSEALLSEFVQKLKKGEDSESVRNEIIEKLTSAMNAIQGTSEAELDYRGELEDMIEKINYTFESRYETRSRFMSFDDFARMADENRLMEISRDILSNARSAKAFFSPIDTNILESLVPKTSKVATKSHNLLEPRNVLDIGERFLTGKGSIGIPALNIPHHVKSQKAGLFYNKKVVLPFEKYNKTESGLISLSGSYDANGEHMISEVLNQIANAIIDIAKKPFPIDINMTRETLNVYLFLTRAGVPISDIVDYMTQPYVVEYFNLKGFNKSIIAKANKLRVKKPLSKIQAKYSLSKDQVSHLKTIDDAARDLTDLILSTAHDTRFPKNRVGSRISLRKYNDVVLGKAWGNFDGLYANSFLKGFRKVGHNANSMFSELFVGDKAGFRKTVDGMEETYFKDSTIDEQERLARMLENDFITYVLQTVSDGSKIISNYAMSLIVGKDSVPARFKAMSKQSTNPIFDELIPVIDSVVMISGRERLTSYIASYSQNLDEYQKQKLVEAFAQLKTEDVTLYNDLIDLLIVQSGVGPSLVTYRELLPSEDFYDRLVSIIENFDESKTYPEFRRLFIANNGLRFLKEFDHPTSLDSYNVLTVKYPPYADINGYGVHVDKNNRLSIWEAISEDIEMADVQGEAWIGYRKVMPLGDGNRHKQYHSSTPLYFDNKKQYIAESEMNDEGYIDVLLESTPQETEKKVEDKAPEPKPINSIRDFIGHSGGAHKKVYSGNRVTNSRKSSDTVFEDVGEEFGVKVLAYTFEGHDHSGKNPVELDAIQLAEANDHLRIANRSLKKTWPTSKPYVNNLLRRNWFQVKNADAIFAVGKVSGTTVDGGTGWAVQLAIDNNKPVYVFDQNDNQWKIWNGTAFVNTTPPILTRNFAGIGTREITDAGIRAVRNLYIDTINSINGDVDLNPETNVNESKTPFCPGG